MPSATPPHVVRVSAGPATVDVTADDDAVTNWITQYFGSWWTVQPAAHQSVAELSRPVLHCRIRPDSYTATQDNVGSRRHRVVEFARKPLQVIDDADGAVCAVDPAERVAYHADVDHTHITLIAAESLGLCLAAALGGGLGRSGRPRRRRQRGTGRARGAAAAGRPRGVGR